VPLHYEIRPPQGRFGFFALRRVSPDAIESVAFSDNLLFKIPRGVSDAIESVAFSDQQKGYIAFSDKQKSYIAFSDKQKSYFATCVFLRK
jgi:hypothetical protein